MTNPNKRRALVCAGLAVWSVLVAVAAQAQDVSFIARRDFDAGIHPQSVAVGDFNGDGVQDLAVANGGTLPSFLDGSVSVLLGNGDGSFQATQYFGAGSGPRSAAVADFNGDGLPDLAVANELSNNVSVLINNTPQPPAKPAPQ